MIAGTIQADGSLLLDEKLSLPPGRVRVIVHSLPQLPEGDPFWQRMHNDQKLVLFDAERGPFALPAFSLPQPALSGPAGLS